MENQENNMEKETVSEAVENITAANHNPLLDRFNKMPPETFRLPSRGTLYNNGELDGEVTNGEVLVYPMTTVDEITMKSPDMLFQGTAVEKVFKRCIPQVNKPLELLSNDVDYLLMCLRMVTYGPTLELKWDCPECKVKKENEKVSMEGSGDIEATHSREDPESFDNVKGKTYAVSLEKLLKKTRPLEFHNNKDFNVELKTGEKVVLKPTTFKEMLNLYQYDVDALTTPEDLEDFVMDGILAVIQSVDGITNKVHIREWAKKCEAPVMESLQQRIHSANDWGTSYTHTFVCNKCSFEYTGEIPLNPIEFFTQPSTNQISL